MKKHTGGEMAKFSTGLSSKIRIRKDMIKEIENKIVLDCFAGLGDIYKQCYANCEYTGLDRRIISKYHENLIEIDNIKFLRSENLDKFTIFDLDAFGTPWHQFGIILHRRTSEQAFLIFCTDGILLKAKFSELPKGLKKYANIPKELKIPCLNRHMDFIRKLYIAEICKLTGHKIIRCKASTNQSKTMRYIGLEIAKGTW